MAVKVGYASRPLAGERVCGDHCGVWHSAERIVLAVADGLGHGEAAAQAAGAAISCIEDHLSCSCEEMFARCDERLTGTRGAALAVVIVEPERARLTVATVGNIRVLLLREFCQLRLDGGRGIVGAGYKNLLPETVALHDGNVLAIFTDGLDEFPALREYIGDRSASAQQQAEAILEHCAHAADDAAVLIFRQEI